MSRHLLILRCGKSSIHKSWINRIKEIIDIAFVYYDNSNYDEDNPKYSFFCEGTKLEGVKCFVDKNTDIINKYEYFWLFEDDIFISYDSVIEIISFINKYNPSLSSPALSEDSFHSHPVTLRNKSLLFRGTDFVECMAPIMSKSFLFETIDKFEEYPLCGIERYWQSLLWDRREIAIIYDKWYMHHTRPLGNGTLHSDSRRRNINSAEDDHRAYLNYGVKFTSYINVLFGIEDKFDPEILTGLDLRQKISSKMESIHNIHGYGTVNNILQKTTYHNNMFSQFMSFDIVKNLFKLKNFSPLESNLITRIWRFGSKIEQICWCESMKLSSDGLILGYKNNNEFYWKVKDNCIFFLSKEKDIKTVFSNIEYKNGKFYIFGIHENDENNIHYLEEV